MAGLQAAQELPGFLLHEELVPGPPAGHRLPGAGHLGGGKRVMFWARTACSQRTLASLAGEGWGTFLRPSLSPSLPLEAPSLFVLSPPSRWPWGSHSHLSCKARRMSQTTRPPSMLSVWHQSPREEKLQPRRLVRRRGEEFIHTDAEIWTAQGSPCPPGQTRAKPPNRDSDLITSKTVS